jgi:BTB/POZ domain
VLSTGPEEKSFTVHKKVLITRAPHFADGLRGGSYREAQEKKFEFPDVDNDVIAVFVSWLYQNTLAEIPDNDTNSFDVTIRLYQFADSINLINLQNLCLDHVGKITKETNWTPKWREIAAHYDNSVPNDMMRILLVDLIAWSFMSSKQANVRSTLKDGLLNEELVVDLFFRINEVGLSSGKGLKPVRSKEWYHVQQSASAEQETPPAS